MAKFYYGGQAVIEGVMMRGRKAAAVAVRRPDDSIYVCEEVLNPKLINRLIKIKGSFSYVTRANVVTC